jgi:hypothetical protein
MKKGREGQYQREVTGSRGEGEEREAGDGGLSPPPWPAHRVGGLLGWRPRRREEGRRREKRDGGAAAEQRDGGAAAVALRGGMGGQPRWSRELRAAAGKRVERRRRGRDRRDRCKRFGEITLETMAPWPPAPYIQVAGPSGHAGNYHGAEG